jgi:hypothetical protein
VKSGLSVAARCSVGPRSEGRRRIRAITRTQPTQSPQERAVLVGAPTREVPAAAAEEHLEELARLTDTAGARVAATVRQRLDAPHPKYYIGEGKARELKSVIGSADASLAIFDEELTPAQGKNLETFLGVRVMDRTELILDIFATRARTREAQMQVELAQLEYLLPRLKRMWTHLSRTRGGIGLRGPGETQLETDRRMINRRIRDLRQKLEVVARRRATQRKARAGEYRVALVGYTNAGKSSLMRALTGSHVYVEDKLFATVGVTTRALHPTSRPRQRWRARYAAPVSRSSPMNDTPRKVGTHAPSSSRGRHRRRAMAAEGPNQPVRAHKRRSAAEAPGWSRTMRPTATRRRMRHGDGWARIA